MTDREQLIEIRKQIILSRLDGKQQAEKDRRTKDLHRMEFTDHEDFMSYVEDSFGKEKETTQVEATDDELDELVGGMFPRESVTYKPIAGEASQAELDELFKNLGI